MSSDHGVERGELLELKTPYLEAREGTAAVWYYGKINVSEFLELGGFINLQTGEVDLRVMVDAALLFCRDESGKRLWGEPHRQRILDWDPVWLVKLTSDMAVIEQLRLDDPK